MYTKTPVASLVAYEEACSFTSRAYLPSLLFCFPLFAVRHVGCFFPRHPEFIGAPPSEMPTMSADVREERNPLGLSIIHKPEHGPPCIDIILVHGLGGKSQDTWNCDSPPFFWPRAICDEPPFQMARIWSYGYSAPGFKALSRKSVAGIGDFGIDLLCRLKDEGTDVSVFLRRQALWYTWNFRF